MYMSGNWYFGDWHYLVITFEVGIAVGHVLAYISKRIGSLCTYSMLDV